MERRSWLAERCSETLERLLEMIVACDWKLFLVVLVSWCSGGGGVCCARAYQGGNGLLSLRLVSREARDRSNCMSRWRD